MVRYHMTNGNLTANIYTWLMCLCTAPWQLGPFNFHSSKASTFTLQGAYGVAEKYLFK